MLSSGGAMKGALAAAPESTPPALGSHSRGRDSRVSNSPHTPLSQILPSQPVSSNASYSAPHTTPLSLPPPTPPLLIPLCISRPRRSRPQSPPTPASPLHWDAEASWDLGAHAGGHGVLPAGVDRARQSSDYADRFDRVYPPPSAPSPAPHPRPRTPPAPFQACSRRGGRRRGNGGETANRSRFGEMGWRILRWMGGWK